MQYFTPQLIALLTAVSVLLILLILIAVLLFVFRRRPVVSKIIWNIKEVRNLFSNIPSYYSQKRIRSTVAFDLAMFVLLDHYWTIRATITTFEACEIAILLLGICGYHLKQTQEEKLSKLQPPGTQ